VAEQELDLLEIPAILAAQFGAGPAEVVGAEMFDPDLLLSRCTQFPESRFFVFNPLPGFECMVVALKPRNFALKPWTKFRLKFVRDLNAKTNLSHFLAAVLFRDLCTKHSADSGI
jgi:hypothetical protein